VTNSPTNFKDLLGLRIYAPPNDFLKDSKDDCTDFSLDEFLKFQQDWGGKGKVPGGDQEIIAQGCVGLCKVALGDVGKGEYPEDKKVNGDETECWAGAGGYDIALAATKKNCSSLQSPVIFSKRGNWAKGYEGTKDGAKVPGKSVVGWHSKGEYDYVTQLGNFFIGAKHDLWKPGNGRSIYDIDRTSKLIRICTTRPSKGGYPAEIWCYRCCQNGSRGYRDGY
jgi:hypothetical protein